MFFKPKFRYRDAVVIVTGATGGIGRAMTVRLVAAGANVVGIGRRQERLDELVSKLGDRFRGVRGDITRSADRERLVESASQIGGGSIDVLINNAGIGAIGQFEDASEDRMRRIFEVDFFAPVELTRLCLPHLRRSSIAAIGNIGSVLGHRAVPEKSEYSAAKFALHGWTDSLRVELRGKISVTLISPSTTQSEFFDSLVDTEPEVQSRSIGAWPADRVAAAGLSAIARRRREVILSPAGKALVYADRIMPDIVDRLL